MTDTVCVIGIVNVKVVGSVENGERIYASRDRPGKAIPQSHMPVGSFLRKKHVLLGMALESKRSSRSLDEVHLTKCFVCIVLDVSRQELLQEIEDLYEVNEKRTEEQIRLSSKKTWRSRSANELFMNHEPAHFCDQTGLRKPQPNTFPYRPRTQLISNQCDLERSFFLNLVCQLIFTEANQAANAAITSLMKDIFALIDIGNQLDGVILPIFTPRFYLNINRFFIMRFQ